MLKLGREFLVIFLVLLQLVAPMIHAHKNPSENLAEEVSFHLPEFEVIKLSHNDSSSLMTAALINEGQIFTVNSGARETQKRHFASSDVSTALLLSFFLVFLVGGKQKLSPSFNVQATHRRERYHLAIPRAPPFSS